MPPGYIGHGGSRGVLRDERSVHANRGGILVGVRGEQCKEFRGHWLVQGADQAS